MTAATWGGAFIIILASDGVCWGAGTGGFPVPPVEDVDGIIDGGGSTPGFLAILGKG